MSCFSIEYIMITPIIHWPYSSTMTINTDDIILCNVTVSVGVIPMWVGPNITQLNQSNCSSNDYISCICTNNPISTYSLITNQSTIYNNNNNQLSLITVALVICKATPTLLSEPFVCRASNINRTVSLIVPTTTMISQSSQSSQSSQLSQSSQSSQLSVTVVSSTRTTLYPPNNNNNNNNNNNKLVIVFIVLFVLLVIGIVILVAMVLFCRCLLHGSNQHNNNIHSHGLYTWFPLVDKREFTREHLRFLEKKGVCMYIID